MKRVVGFVSGDRDGIADDGTGGVGNLIFLRSSIVPLTPLQLSFDSLVMSFSWRYNGALSKLFESRLC